MSARWRRGFVFPGFLIFSLCVFRCAQQDPARARSDEIFNLAVYSYESSGNCLHNYRQGSELGKQSCSRASRTQCQQNVLYDPSGNLIVTAATQNRYRTEWANLAKTYPDCNTTAAALSALPGYRATTGSFNNSVSTNNTLTILDDCSSLGDASLSKLADSSQYGFLISARGAMSWEAKTLGQTACFNVLPLSQSERDTAVNFSQGNLILETTCLYGSSAFVTVCNPIEKQYAARFDFNNPL